MSMIDRRRFLQSSAVVAAGLSSASLPASMGFGQSEQSKPSKMRFGLVTYKWGADWDLPTLITNCQKAGAEGVELRTTHKHGVEPSLDATQRREVKAALCRRPGDAGWFGKCRGLPLA